MNIFKRILNSLLGKHVVTWIFNPTAVFEKATLDYNRYIVTCRSKVTLVGKIKVTEFKPVLMNDAFTSDVEELLDNRFSKEPFFYRGSREELMEAVPSLTNHDFDNCEMLDALRIAKIQSFISQVTEPNRNIIHIFKHWLRTQVELGVISEIDGYVFVNNEAKHQLKNCETGDFIYKYYDSLRKAYEYKLIPSTYDSVAHLASAIMQTVTENAFGISNVNLKELFIPINSMLRDDVVEASPEMELKRMEEIPLPNEQINTNRRPTPVRDEGETEINLDVCKKHGIGPFSKDRSSVHETAVSKTTSDNTENKLGSDIVETMLSIKDLKDLSLGVTMARSIAMD